MGIYKAELYITRDAAELLVYVAASLVYNIIPLLVHIALIQ